MGTGEDGQELVGVDILKKNRGEQIAKAVSIVLHPFLMPLWCCIVLLYGPTYLYILPNPLKLYILGVFTLTCLFFPAFTTGVFRSLRIIPNLSLNSRRERTLPLLVVAVGYAVCYFLLARYVAIGLLPPMLLGALGIVIVCFACNLYWKISLHMAAIGGVIAVLMDVMLKGYGLVLVPLISFIVLAGILGTARLYQGKHDIWQVLAGFCVGIVMMSLIMNTF